MRYRGGIKIILICWVAAWVLYCPKPTMALERTVRVTGVGFIQGGDKAAARDQAVRDAQLRAVEQAAGVDVDSRSALHKSLLIDDTLLTRSRGTVRSYRIIKEAQDEFGLYRVEMEAVVDHSILKKSLAKIAGEKKILILYRLYQSNGSGGDHMLAERLAAEFQNASFQVQRMEMAQHTFNQLDSVKIANLAKSSGCCDLVLTVRAEALDSSCPVKNMCAVRAEGYAVLFEGAGGRRFMKFAAEKVRGFGSTVAAARRDAFVQTADTVTAQMVSELISPTGIEARIEVLRLADLSAYRSFKRVLTSLRWVTGVKEDTVGFHPNRSVFLVSFAQEADYLAGMLKRIQGFELSRRSGGTFVLEPITHGR